MVNLQDSVMEFIRHPIPTWDIRSTEALVQALMTSQITRRHAYNLGEPLCTGPGGVTYLHNLGFEGQGFYEENGLVALSEAELKEIKAVAKILGALEVLEIIDSVGPCISQLVRRMVVVGSEDADVDVSYSHPYLPDTIFFSVCCDNGAVSRLRVAESILHEAMHLKLSLIEKMAPIVNGAATGKYYSPWRDELRPAHGVVHGIFVFRTLQEFFRELEGRVKDRDAVAHAQVRHRQIGKDLASLSGFENCPDLTPIGASLVGSLLR